MRFEYRFVDPKQKEEIGEQNASVITELLDTVINETALEASIELNSLIYILPITICYLTM